MKPGDQREDLVGRAHLEPTRAAVITIGVEVHRGGGDSSAVFGVIKDFVLSHGEDPPGAHLHTAAGAAELKTLLIVGNELPDAVLSGGLQGHVQCCVDIEATFAPALVALLRGSTEAFEVLHVLDDVVAEESRIGVSSETPGGRWRQVHKVGVHRGVDGALVFRFGEVVLGIHGSKDDVASLLVGRKIVGVFQVSGRWILHDRHEACGFRRVEIFRRLTEVFLCRSLHTVGVSAKARDVEVGLQDLVFAVRLLQTNRELHLVEFALKAGFNGGRIRLLAFLFCGEILRPLNVGVFHQLHRQSRGTTFDCAGEDVAQCCANHRVHVHTGVVIKTPVFPSDRCVSEVG